MYKRSQPSTRDPFTHEYKDNRQRSQFSANDEVPDHNSKLDLNLETYINDKKFIQLLRKKGVKNLFKIQAAVFNFVYQGRDIIARDRTGSGKTLAFTLPVLERLRQRSFEHRYPKMLVILPTRQLAIQVNNEIQSLRFSGSSQDFQTMVVYGKSNIQDNIYKLNRGTDILVGTPGRLNDLIQRSAIRLDDLQVLVLDEADQMLKQGFQQQVQKICQAIKRVNSKKVQTLLFSATVPDWVHNLSDKYQSQAKYINMINDQQIRTSKEIRHCAVDISRCDQGQVVKIIQQMIHKYGGEQKRVLIFCQKKVDVDKLSRQLSINNASLHGDVHQSKRQRAYHSFKNGSLRCIVATNVAARGLDFPSVDLVVQMSPPLNTEQYIHRAGRTGRAGKKGTCLTFYDRTRSRLIYKIESQAKIKIQQIKYDSISNGSGSYQNRQSRRSYSQRNDSNQNRNDYQRDRRENASNRRDSNQQSRRNNRYEDRNSQRKTYDSNRDPRNRQDYQRRDINNFQSKNNDRTQRSDRYINNRDKSSQRQTPSDFKRSPVGNQRKRSNSSCSRSNSRTPSPKRHNQSPRKRNQNQSFSSRKSQRQQQITSKSSISYNQKQDIDY